MYYCESSEHTPTHTHTHSHSHVPVRLFMDGLCNIKSKLSHLHISLAHRHAHGIWARWDVFFEITRTMPNLITGGRFIHCEKKRTGKKKEEARGEIFISSCLLLTHVSHEREDRSCKTGHTVLVHWDMQADKWENMHAQTHEYCHTRVNTEKEALFSMW